MPREPTTYDMLCRLIVAVRDNAPRSPNADWRIADCVFSLHRALTRDNDTGAHLQQKEQQEVMQLLYRFVDLLTTPGVITELDRNLPPHIKRYGKDRDLDTLIMDAMETHTWGGAERKTPSASLMHLYVNIRLQLEITLRGKA